MRRFLPPLLALLMAVAPPALAAGDPAEQLAQGPLEDRARALGRQLRCLVCQNQSIEDSDADLARDLRRVVRERVAAGEGDAAVLAHLTARYGDFVLLRPPLNAATALLWASPALALGGGLALVLLGRRRAAAPAALVPLDAAARRRLERLGLPADPADPPAPGGRGAA